MEFTETKICTGCWTDKSVDHFYRHKSSKNGIEARCKACKRKAAREKNYPPTTEGTKQCHVCNKDKPVAEFHKRKINKDGLHGKCKRCVSKAGKKKNYQPRTVGEKFCTGCGKNMHVSEFGKDRSSKDGLFTYCKKCAVKRSVYSHKKTGYEQREDVKAKKRVTAKTRHAIKTGEIKRKYNCEFCNSFENIEVHHKSYDKPNSYLDVTFLCRSCHDEEHIRINGEDEAI